MLRLLTRCFVGVLLAFGCSGCDLVQRAMTLASEQAAPPEVGVPPSDAVPPPPPPAEPSPKAPSAAPAPAPRFRAKSGVMPPLSAGAQPPAGAAMSFAELATRTNPAVVFVRTISSQRRGFRRVLGEGSGSGFVFDPDGKILTNHHVIKGAHAIQVELQDGRALAAEVIGADPLTDLAVLSVPAAQLPALPLGDSDAIRVGDWVVAIGNPFGLEHTVSAGIISAKERTNQDVKLGDPNAYYSFLQTDASINPGNSGGPLLDLRGQVVGINTAINQGANNIGFAIPINMIAELLPRLLKEGKVDRAAIGVHVDDVSPEDVARFALPDRRGAMIVRVVTGGPAHRAKMQAGDVLVEYGDHRITSPETLRWYASLSAIGKPVSAVVLRAGKRVRLSLSPVPLRTR